MLENKIHYYTILGSVKQVVPSVVRIDRIHCLALEIETADMIYNLKDISAGYIC